MRSPRARSSPTTSPRMTCASTSTRPGTRSACGSRPDQAPGIRAKPAGLIIQFAIPAAERRVDGLPLAAGDMDMDEPPDLPDTEIIEALRANFRVQVADLVFLPVGNDSGSWSYRLRETAGRAYFLKVRAPADDVRGAEVPAYLQRIGVPSVLAPLPAGTGAAWIRAGRFALALYPYIEGRPAAEAGLSADQWRQFGAIV